MEDVRSGWFRSRPDTFLICATSVHEPTAPWVESLEARPRVLCQGAGHAEEGHCVDCQLGLGVPSNERVLLPPPPPPLPRYHSTRPPMPSVRLSSHSPKTRSGPPIRRCQTSSTSVGGIICARRAKRASRDDRPRRAERRQRPAVHPNHKPRMYPRFLGRQLSGVHQGPCSSRWEFHAPFCFQLVGHQTGHPHVTDKLVV